MGFADDEEWTRPSGAVPTRPRYLRFAEAKFKPETFKYGGIKRQSAVEIVYTGEYMREQLQRSLKEAAIAKVQARRAHANISMRSRVFKDA